MADKTDLSRREFVLGGVGGAVLTAASGTFVCARALAGNDLPAGKKPVPGSDATAKALNYVPNAKKVDAAKFPQRKPDQFCDSCSFYKGLNDKWGDCQILPSGVVAAKGWCSSWVKKS